MSEERFVLASLDKVVWVFPVSLIVEVVIVERDKLLNLPFYNNAILGCIHHGGEIITLVSLQEILGAKGEQIRVKIRGKITLIRLSKFVEGLGEVGIVVDRILGRKNRNELPETLFLSSENSDLRLFSPEILKSEIWQPVRSLLKSNR